jgi:UDP-N-acetylmuramyl pentapeptide phosphotransferase/UDP-N-acetylglucosamine-1-phosphate transferase
MSWFLSILIGLIPMFATAIATGLFLKILRRKNIFDHPNERSSHKNPTPRGAGIPVILVIIFTWVSLYLSGNAFDKHPIFWVVVAGSLGLGFISWIDDSKGGISPTYRLLVQLLVVSLSIAFLPKEEMIFQGLVPIWIDRLIAGLALLWFTNLYNFMDGIDGISGAKAVTIGLGIFLISIISDSVINIGLPGLCVASVAIGFLFWNWQPAKVFLGDVGSIPLGYLIGWLLLYLAIQGHWAEALLLPAYYLADTTITLVKRLAHRKKPWVAHRDHAYQVAVTFGNSHAKVSIMISLVGILLVGLALLATDSEILRWLSLGLGTILVLIFVYYLQTQKVANK